jgi:hypothetical protein
MECRIAGDHRLLQVVATRGSHSDSVPNLRPCVTRSSSRQKDRCPTPPAASRANTPSSTSAWMCTFRLSAPPNPGPPRRGLCAVGWESLNDGHGAPAWLLEADGARVVPQQAEYGAQEDSSHPTASALRAAADRSREGGMRRPPPLDMARGGPEQRRRTATGTERPPLVREGDQPVQGAAVAAKPREPPSQESAAASDPLQREPGLTFSTEQEWIVVPRS